MIKTDTSEVLVDLVKQIQYKPNWEIFLGNEVDDNGARGRSLLVVSYPVHDSTYSGSVRDNHGFPIPSFSYDRDAWAFWILDRISYVEALRTRELFQVNDG